MNDTTYKIKMPRGFCRTPVAPLSPSQRFDSNRKANQIASARLPSQRLDFREKHANPQHTKNCHLLWLPRKILASPVVVTNLHASRALRHSTNSPTLIGLAIVLLPTSTSMQDALICNRPTFVFHKGVQKLSFPYRHFP